MRTLFEIIEGAKDGTRPDHDECYYAMLALRELFYFDHKDLRNLALDNTKIPPKSLAHSSSDRFRKALNVSPQDWLGPHVPGNASFDAFRALGQKILDKVIAMRPARMIVKQTVAAKPRQHVARVEVFVDGTEVYNTDGDNAGAETVGDVDGVCAMAVRLAAAIAAALDIAIAVE